MEDDTTFAALAEVLKPMNTTKDIADRCGIKEGTLAYWRGAGIGPLVIGYQSGVHLSSVGLILPI